jgi:hypothetical protein
MRARQWQCLANQQPEHLEMDECEDNGVAPRRAQAAHSETATGRRPFYLPASRPETLLAYGRNELTGHALAEVRGHSSIDDEQARRHMDSLDAWIGGVLDRALTAVREANGMVSDTLVLDLDLVRAIPGEIARMPRAIALLGYAEAAAGLRASLSLARTARANGLAALAYAEVLAAALKEEAHARWLSEWAITLREHPWLRVRARWPEVRLIDINCEQPWFVVKR